MKIKKHFSYIWRLKPRINREIFDNLEKGELSSFDVFFFFFFNLQSHFTLYPDHLISFLSRFLFILHMSPYFFLPFHFYNIVFGMAIWKNKLLIWTTRILVCLSFVFFLYIHLVGEGSGEKDIL